MEIRNPSGGAAASAIAVSRSASYRLYDLPDVPGSVLWSLSGDTTAVTLKRKRDENEVSLAAAAQPSAQVGATTLTATFMPADHGPSTSASLTITVFAAAICNLDPSLAPSQLLGVGNRARYAVAAVPAVSPVSASWSPGDSGDIALLGVDAQGTAEILGQQAGQTPAQLTLTLSCASQDAVAVLPITVLGLRAALYADDEAAIEAGPLLGVGEVRVARAQLVPAQAQLGTATAQWRWSCSSGLQIMGDANAAAISFVANAVGPAWVEAQLSIAGSVLKARQECIAFGVAIVGEQGSAPTALAVGASATLQAQLQPDCEEAQFFWTGSGNVALRSEGASVIARAVSPSSSEGADGLGVVAVIGDAQTQAVIPLTSYAVTILSGDQQQPPTTIAVGAQQTYSVTTNPAFGEPQIRWSLQGEAAGIVGSSNASQVQLYGVRNSESSGDLLLAVAVSPAGTPGDSPDAALAITVGTPRYR